MGLLGFCLAWFGDWLRWVLQQICLVQRISFDGLVDSNGFWV